MLLTQHSAPRWKKEWIPLATQQLRLRNLIKILAFSIKNDKKGTIESNASNVNENNCVIKESYYFTLHATIMSAPFYTSEKLKSGSPKWRELEVSSWEGNVCNSVDSVVIRLWFSNPQYSEDKVLSVWGVYMSGLMYLGPNLKGDIPLKPNSIVFLMPGGYFTDPKCLDSNIHIRYSSVIVRNCDVRLSYSVNTLKRLQTMQHVIKKEMAEADILKKKISKGEFFRSESRGRTTLRKILNKHKPKTNQIDLLKVKESIEIIKYKVNILKQEREILLQRIKNLNDQVKLLSNSNQLLETKIMDNYKNLKKEIHLQREWKRSYISRREKYLHSKALLNFRTKQLISELNLIYPIIEVSPDKYTICGVHLPNSEDFAGHDELQLSIALGFVTHIIQMISVFLQIPLRYPVIHFGSRSKIIDLITDKVPDSEREFCLYVKGKEKLQFHYAVYLLNKNIAQMRWLCGLPTSDLRNTLENLSSLVKLKCESSTLDHNSQSLSSSTADICSSNMSISSPLGSVLSFQSKRYLKGHLISESAIDYSPKTINNSNHNVSAHHVSKSMDSSKELMTTLFLMKSKGANESDKIIKNNLSCSLDKGLNEYEETLGRLKKEEEQFGSEPTLNFSKKNSKNIESKASHKFLKPWKSGSQNIPFSDEESEVHMIDLSNRKQQNFHSAECTTENDVKEQFTVFGYDNTNKGTVAEERGNDVETSNEFCNVNVVEISKSAESDLWSKCSKANICQAKVCELKSDLDDRKLEPKSVILLEDKLLENVTNRTEALVNQTTSFNRFKTKFKGTLDSTN